MKLSLAHSTHAITDSEDQRGCDKLQLMVEKHRIASDKTTLADIDRCLVSNVSPTVVKADDITAASAQLLRPARPQTRVADIDVLELRAQGCRRLWPAGRLLWRDTGAGLALRVLSRHYRSVSLGIEAARAG